MGSLKLVMVVTDLRGRSRRHGGERLYHGVMNGMVRRRLKSSIAWTEHVMLARAISAIGGGVDHHFVIYHMLHMRLHGRR